MMDNVFEFSLTPGKQIFAALIDMDGFARSKDFFLNFRNHWAPGREITGQLSLDAGEVADIDYDRCTYTGKALSYCYMRLSLPTLGVANGYLTAKVPYQLPIDECRQVFEAM